MTISVADISADQIIGIPLLLSINIVPIHKLPIHFQCCSVYGGNIAALYIIHRKTFTIFICSYIHVDPFHPLLIALQYHAMQLKCIIYALHVCIHILFILYYVASKRNINLVLPRLFTYFPSSRAQKT